MAWGTLTLGRVTLKETFTVADTVDSNGLVSLSLSGQETNPGMSVAEVQARQQDILGLMGKVLPVTFSSKSDHNGYYQVVSADADMLRWPDAAATRWGLGLVRLGFDNAVDIESRVSNTVRLNDFAQVGTRWHSPAAAHYGYFTGTTNPSGSVVRNGTDGGQTVYLGVPANVVPRWGCPVGSFRSGRVRFLSGSIERAAVGFSQANTGWTLDNGLVRVSPLAANGQLLIESFEATGGFPLNANPYFETNANDWFGTGGTVARSTAQSHEGAASLLLTPDGVSANTEANASAVTAVAGTNYRVSAWVRCAVARNINLQINWHSSGAFNSSVTSPNFPVLANTWTLIEFDAVCPPIATPTGIMYVKMTGTPPAGNLLHIDEAKFLALTGPGNWEGKNWNIAKGGATTPLGTPDQIMVLRNDFECVVVRLMRNAAPGRTMVDLTLRRGSRFVEVYIQTNASTTLGAYLNSTEAFTDQSANGYMVATANDAAGNKAACGSARSFTANLNGGLSKAAVTTMDLWIGSVVGGTAALAGDIATDLRDQYIASMSENTGVVAR